MRKIDAKGRDVLIVIITDGYENASREFTKDQILALIKEKEALGWKFVFLGAEIDSYAVGGAIGMSVGATANYTKGNEQVLYSNLVQSTMMRSASIKERGLRATNCMAFFDDDQKSAMVDNSTGLGGGTAGSLGFPPPAHVGPVTTTAAPTTRQWTTTKVPDSGGGSTGA